MEKKKVRIDLRVLVPFMLLFFVTVFFTILTKGALLRPYNMKNILNQAIPTMIAGMGMVFVISMGGTDISHGSLAALSGTLAIMAALEVNGALLFPVALLTGIISGAFVGIVNTRFKVSSFMITLSMNIALRALVNVIIGSKTYQMQESSRQLINGMPFKLAMLILLAAMIAYLFNYTKLGFYVKAIGENENAVRHAGINVDKVKVIAFIISGFMASLAGIFIIARVGGVNNTIASSFHMNVLMALYVAGIPVKGGMESKLYKLLIGAPLITILESGMVLCGVSGPITQAVRGVVMLVSVVFTNYINDRLYKLSE